MYEPQEDSYLMAKHLDIIVKKYRPQTFLDIGCGSGIQSKTALNAGINKKNILAVDIDSEALKETKKLGVKAIKSDLFKKIKEKDRFDLIAFNAPYLPEDKHDKSKDLCGGKKGFEIIERFLKEAKKHLNTNGKILLLFSSLTNKEKIEQIIKKECFIFQEIANEKYFMEEIYLLLLEKT